MEHTTDSWKERFEQKRKAGYFTNSVDSTPNFQHIEEYIESLLSEERERLWEKLEPKGRWIGADETKEYVIPWETVNALLTKDTD